MGRKEEGKEGGWEGRRKGRKEVGKEGGREGRMKEGEGAGKQFLKDICFYASPLMYVLYGQRSVYYYYYSFYCADNKDI